MRWAVACVVGAVVVGLLGGAFGLPKLLVAVGGAAFGLILAARLVRSM